MNNGITTTRPDTSPSGASVDAGVEGDGLGLPPVVCASWCSDGDGHRNASHPLDQRCYSMTPEQVTLLHHEPDRIGGRFVLAEAVVYLTRERFDAEPRIKVAVNDDPVVTMTPAEAQVLYQQLGEALAQAGT